jgi:hypothetical protein
MDDRAERKAPLHDQYFEPVSKEAQLSHSVLDALPEVYRRENVRKVLFKYPSSDDLGAKETLERWRLLLKDGHIDSLAAEIIFTTLPCFYKDRKALENVEIFINEAAVLRHDEFLEALNFIARHMVIFTNPHLSDHLLWSPGMHLLSEKKSHLLMAMHLRLWGQLPIFKEMNILESTLEKVERVCGDVSRTWKPNWQSD